MPWQLYPSFGLQYKELYDEDFGIYDKLLVIGPFQMRWKAMKQTRTIMKNFFLNLLVGATALGSIAGVIGLIAFVIQYVPYAALVLAIIFVIIMSSVIGFAIRDIHNMR